MVQGVETVDRLMSYFEQEHAKFKSVSRLDRDVSSAFKVVGHLLLWGNLLIEHHRGSKTGFDEFFRDDEAFEIVEGIRFVRHRVFHQFHQALEVTRGAAFPIPYPVPFFEIRWVKLDRLPASEKRHEHSRIGVCYEKALQGLPVRFTFEALSEFFERAKKT